MIFYSPKVSYEVVSIRDKGQVNECYIARNSLEEDGSLYLLLLIKEHETVRKLLNIFRMMPPSEESR